MGSQSRTQLNDFTFIFHIHTLEKEMTAHSSVLAWRIPGTGEPGGLPSVGSQGSKQRPAWYSQASFLTTSDFQSLAGKIRIIIPDSEQGYED